MIPARRLEDRIRELSARVAETSSGAFEAAIAELQIALSEHAMRVQNKNLRNRPRVARVPTRPTKGLAVRSGGKYRTFLTGDLYRHASKER